jgi:hypothetical protein
MKRLLLAVMSSCVSVQAVAPNMTWHNQGTLVILGGAGGSTVLDSTIGFNIPVGYPGSMGNIPAGGSISGSWGGPYGVSVGDSVTRSGVGVVWLGAGAVLHVVVNGVDIGSGGVATLGADNDVYLYGGDGGGGGPAVSTNSRVCATIQNQQPFGQYYGFTDASGNVLGADVAGNNAIFVRAGETRLLCITVGTGTNVSLVTLTADNLGKAFVQGGPNPLPGYYWMTNPDVSLVQTNLASTPIPPGSPGTGLTSTNNVTSPGGNAGGVGYVNPSVDGLGTNGLPISYTSTNTGAATDGTLRAGFDAVYTGEARIIQGIQTADQHNATGVGAVASGVTGLGASLTSMNGALGTANGTLTGMNTTLSGVSTGISGLGVDGVATTNLLGSVKGDLDKLTNAPGYDTNADALLLAISNNTKQAELYTNVDQSVTNVNAVMANGTAAVGTNLDGLTSMAGSAQGLITSLSGWGPGSVGTDMTLTLPGAAVGGTRINFDPGSISGISDIVAWIRVLVTWGIYIVLTFKIIDELWRGMAIVFAAPQGRFPQFSILGNTVGGVAAPAYVIGLCLVLTGALVGFLVFFGGFTGAILTSAIINPLGNAGVAGSVSLGLRVLNEFVPIGLFVQALFFWLMVRVLAVKIVAAAAIIVRAFVACAVFGLFCAASADGQDVAPNGFDTAVAVPVVFDNGLGAAVELRVSDGGGTYRFSFWVQPGFGRDTMLWVPDATSGVQAVQAGLASCAVALDLSCTNTAHVSFFSDSISLMAGTHYTGFEPVQGMSDAELAWMYAGMGLALSIWIWAYSKRTVASLLGHESDAL